MASIWQEQHNRILELYTSDGKYTISARVHKLASRAEKVRQFINDNKQYLLLSSFNRSLNEYLIHDFPKLRKMKRSSTNKRATKHWEDLVVHGQKLLIYLNEFIDDFEDEINLCEVTKRLHND